MSSTQVIYNTPLNTTWIVYNLLFFRYRLSEISFVLKALTTLVISMKKAGIDKGNY